MSDSYGLNACEAVKNCIFCSDIEAKKNYIFNKKVTEERFNEVYAQIRSFAWRPNFANWYDIKGNKAWWAFCFPQLETVEPSVAWGKMPKKMNDYIHSLPEFNKTVWRKITGAKE